MSKARVLVVDDEPEMVKYVSTNLRARGYEVLAAEDGRTALKLLRESWADLIILDIILPGMDGFQVCQAIRLQSKVPIIMLSARGQEKDIVQALDLGADDYLTKPFGTGELLARMRVALRHAARVADGAGDSAFETGDLRVDLAARRVFVKGEEVRLTRTEYNLLATLARHAGKVVTHRQLLQEVWGPGSAGQSHYLRVYMGQLRHKLEADAARPRYLLTETGVGYRLAVD